eukprot:scaffold86476_cov19-Tisochrysis_lutea.AAC.1
MHALRGFLVSSDATLSAVFTIHHTTYSLLDGHVLPCSHQAGCKQGGGWCSFLGALTPGLYPLRAYKVYKDKAFSQDVRLLAFEGLEMFESSKLF